MARKRPRLINIGTIGIGALLLVLLVALDLMSNAVQNSESLSRIFVPLLFLVLIGLMVLAVTVVVSIIRLTGRYRRQAAGSRLTGRMLALFALISLLPVGVVYYYSLGFLLRGIDSWFDVEIDQAMENALTLNQASLDLNQRVMMRYASQLLAGIEDRSTTALTLTLGQLRRQAGAQELTLFSNSGEVMGTASDDPLQLVPNQPERKLMQSVRGGEDYVGLETTDNNQLQVRVLVNDPRARPLILQAIFPTSARISELAAQLEDAYNRYTELSYLRQSLKFSFLLTLSMVLIFGLMAALLAAFRTAQRLVAPIADIARGTRAVASGDYDQQLPLPTHDDELAFLVSSFNAMTRRVAQARDEAARSQQKVEEQRAYLETVLGRLSSGVLAFSEELRLTTSNPAARQILRLESPPQQSPSLNELEACHPWLSHWAETLRRQFTKTADWRAEVTLFGGEGRQVLMCRGSRLPVSGTEATGYVLVFDDITELIRAQRDAAWGEVARRLAHEIKNPLTPIQLSAERLRHKLLKKLDEQDARIVDRSTTTIVAQVEAMKAMVNDFSSYARSPEIQHRPFEIDALIRDVLELYRGGPVRVQADLKAGKACIRGDSKRLRQVIHNLIKNAIEALENTPNAEVTIRSSLSTGIDIPAVVMDVEDNGAGFDAKLLQNAFEPYVTSKTKGTGLGLAIVKKIIEEHSGIIAAQNTEHGARIRAQLPLWQAPDQAPDQAPGQAPDQAKEQVTGQESGQIADQESAQQSTLAPDPPAPPGAKPPESAETS
ncbi:sensor histidine kinase [Thiorhodovibrio frisius]|uniref:histidine kinase n=1 Tax=Thiorhodovibrio frisius TaxID=631362 RepID=H8YX79_9GAMM|nr:ATP-binding protein [Thiorhodovibrio frisius]EIC23055.1 signal transduction histidine kinase involved in nitrogen fixation and metabolism regulation [Thiorhodovibrio frisius]WPL22680.1 Globin-coupled histidine kinase [Thiorhodovibrio frisius]